MKTEGEARMIDEMTDKYCGRCKYWNMKVSAEQVFGTCMNEDVTAYTYVSHRDPVVEARYQERGVLPRIMFAEYSFGCIYWKAI